MMDMFEALNPQPGKASTRVNKSHYEAYRKALLKVIPRRKAGIAFRELPDLVLPHLPTAVADATKPMWWVTTVKLDLEARGMIERVAGITPQHLRRV